MSLFPRRLGALIAPVAIGAALLGGCGSVDGPLDAVSQSYGLKLFREHRSPLCPSYTERLIAAKTGGKVILNRHTVVVPPGGLKDDETLTVSEPSPSHVVVDLGPDGLGFLKDVQLTVCYRGLDLGKAKEEKLTIYRYDPETAEWVDMSGKVDTANKLVTIWTNHFSRYALSDH